MRSWIIAAALVFAAPAFAQTPAPAPSPEGAVRVAASQAGETVSVSTDAALAVELQNSPSAGTSWAIVSQPDFLGEAQTLTGPTVTSTRPLVGAPRWQVFVFAVTGGGAGDLVLEKRARDGGVLETFSVSVAAE